MPKRHPYILTSHSRRSKRTRFSDLDLARKRTAGARWQSQLCLRDTVNAIPPDSVPRWPSVVVAPSPLSPSYAPNPRLTFPRWYCVPPSLLPWRRCMPRARGCWWCLQCPLRPPPALPTPPASPPLTTTPAWLGQLWPATPCPARRRRSPPPARWGWWCSPAPPTRPPSPAGTGRRRGCRPPTLSPPTGSSAASQGGTSARVGWPLRSPRGGGGERHACRGAGGGGGRRSSVVLVIGGRGEQGRGEGGGG